MLQKYTKKQKNFSKKKFGVKKMAILPLIYKKNEDIWV